ncbi:hypothetical protein DL89DRAFT_266182 [Linderina pennispora]|uniref:Nucleoporin Nup133/Nup155-like C-terminal domain-containing protein n=1 Tax=Linderina pennispora TaxID=61395 RepID=A0A1Y1WC94_9FUNG|nr:uncharacterized protein DL89DRAFT_266182 [Linderina pennispora]ORX71161.1 hypothetical protein DL89DRAFT_266182 [Linderina pennispora]
MDLGAHLRERYRFAHSVMKLSDKLSRTARVQLCANAEKLGAALSLWGYQSEVWSNQDSPSSELLTKVASHFLDGLGLQSKDPVRLFFKHHVASMGGLLATMHRMLASMRRALEKSARGIIDSQHVAYEGNRILICILQSAYNYRFRNAELYGLADESEESGSCERWTDTILTIDMLAARLCRDISGQHSALFYNRIKETVLPGDEDADGNATGTSVLDDAVSVSLANLPDMSEADAHKPLANDDPFTSPLALLHEAINQIGMMANLCLRVFVDRLNLLQATSPNEVHDLTRRYEGVRSRILLLLVPLGRASTAFRLAEEYQDLRVLAVLTFTTDTQRAAERVRVYVGMFGKEFAGALFEYYERRGAWASLLNTRDESFDAWLKEYIDAHQHGVMPLISWIHDVKMADFGRAAERLIRAGRDAQEVAQARTMLSLSKLAFFTDESQVLNCFTSLVRAHTELADDGKGAESAAVLSTTADPAPAIAGAFVYRSWDGKMLAVEDLIDVLTLPDNVPNTSGADSSALDEHTSGLDERSSLALDVLSRASFSLPDQAYKSALRTIWRRAFTRDDWPAIHAKLQGGQVPGSVLRDVLTNTYLYRMLDEVFAEGYVNYMATVRLAPQFVAENARRLGHPVPVAPTTLRTAIDSSLDAYYSEVMRMVVDDAVPERQQELQLLLQHIMPAKWAFGD